MEGFDGRFDGRFDEMFDGGVDGRFDGRFDERLDGRFDGRFEATSLSSGDCRARHPCCNVAMHVAIYVAMYVAIARQEALDSVSKFTGSRLRSEGVIEGAVEGSKKRLIEEFDGAIRTGVRWRI